MSGAVTLTTVATAAAAVGAAATVYSAVEQRKAGKAQQAAMNQANEAAQRQNNIAEQAINAAQKKRPNIAAIQGTNRAADMEGGGTMLTGPTGVDPSTLNLAKNTLLGG